MEEKQITITIDGKKVKANPGQKLLEVAHSHNIAIPTFCKHPLLNPVGACRLCVVEVKGVKKLQASCSTPISDGMEVFTHTDRVQKTRRVILELLLANHNCYCPTCVMNEHCSLQDYCKMYGVRVVPFMGEMRKTTHDYQGVIQREQSKCILCGQCVAVCRDIQNDHAIDFYGRGFQTNVGTPYDIPLKDTCCMNCGQCVIACPTGSLKTRSDTDTVLKLLNDPKNYIMVQTAPAVRIAIGEEFGFPAGTITTGKLVNALKLLGFKKVYDTNLGADMTIIEEGNELLERLKSKKNLPIITSCCPGWVKYSEHYYHSLLKNLSTAKSPHQMLGAVSKRYFAKLNNVKPKNVIMVSIMPCCAKKFESERPEMQSEGIKDVDYVLTTRELADLIRQANIDFADLPDKKFDDENDKSTGAGQIFGATGGVMEAALRTVVELISEKPLKKIDFNEVRGIYKGIKIASIPVKTTRKEFKHLDKINIAVVHGISNATKILDEVLKGNPNNYHFIEVMACPGGCINGGGQPFYKDFDTVEKRKQGIYAIDKNKKLRKSHESPLIQKIYKDFLGKPLGKNSHKYLHTHYLRRSMFNISENPNT